MLTRTALLAALLALSSNVSAQPAGLRIVVVKGEDAVNIIQQKTAVAPLVEVRDRNNLPVSGATVTFTLGGNSAVFAGGAQTLTVVTNAAGQAAAAGLSPLASGAVQINVAAAFQGQTAIAAIAQTNVMTAAEAAGAAASSASGATGATGGSTGATSGAAGGAAGGGGGLSATTIGIVGAAVAGGAVAATQVAGGDSSGKRGFAGPLAGQLTLSFAGCTRVHEMTGTITMELDSLTGAITGTAHVEGTSRVISVNCSGGPQLGANDRFGFSTTPVTGSPSGMIFSKQESNQFQDAPNLPVGTNTQTFSFSGALTGETIAGTLIQAQKIESNAGVTSGSGTITYTVTLRPN